MFAANIWAVHVSWIYQLADNCKILQFFHSSDSFLWQLSSIIEYIPPPGLTGPAVISKYAYIQNCFDSKSLFLKKHPRSIPLFAQHISLNATLVWRISLNATIAGHIYSSKHIARVNKSTKLSRSIVKLLVQFVHPVKLNIKKAVWIRSFIRMLNIYVSPIQSSGKKCLHLRQPGPHHSLGATSFDVAWCGPSILDVEHSFFQGRVSFQMCFFFFLETWVFGF